MAGEVEVIPPKKRRRGRLRSLRSLIADMREYRKAVDAGLISSADGQRRCAMVHLEAELQCVQQEMELRGMAEPVQIDPGPEEQWSPPQIKAHRTKKVAVKRGVGRHGEAVDEKSVVVTSSLADDEDAEHLTEIEAIA